MRPCALALLATVTAAPAVGCAAPDDGVLDTTFDVCAPLVLEGDATPAQQASLDQAQQLWRDRGAVGLGVAGADAATLPVVFAPGAAVFHGYYDDEAGVLYVNAGAFAGDSRAITIAHELGHAFGLWHVDAGERLSVMNPGNLTIAPTEDDQRAIEALWGRCPRAAGPTGDVARR
ncbi:MAG: hypothetical protein H6709_01020 [Kofleriaceae bacterium]|nr:hypothetical protein [Myxococcales bacterium]MCB9558797.1 hypothetical protein [Kofleriaceae bacterium]MCB9570649.1 hypothetical protein [Kofleriaceae bacterium]